MTTKTAAKMKGARSGLSPGFSPVSRGAAPAGQRQAPASLAPAPSRRGKITPLTPMRTQTARQISKLADHVQKDHPDMIVHEHLRDAARTLRAGNEEASQRHLRAAMFSVTPQSMMRNGFHTDDSHLAARQAMHGIHRHLLLVKDITDVAAKNQASLRRDSYDDDSSAPMPQPPAHDAGYGPGALAQKPTARQPGGDKALNAPNRGSSGGSDPNVADPVGPQPRGSKQFAYGWGDLDTLIEMAVVAGETGTIGARTPATAGTARGHGRPDESRTTWPSLNSRSTRTTQVGIRRSGNSEARQRDMPASTAAGRPLTGRRSTAETERARTTSSPSVFRATTSTTDLATEAIAASATGGPSSRQSRFLPSTVARPRDRQLLAESSAYPRRPSTTSSTAGSGRTSPALSAPTSRPAVSGAGAIPPPGSSANRPWPSTPGGTRARQPSAGSSAYPRRLSGASSTGRRGRTSLELSAETGRLAATPSPRGKPGGPGLYGVKGNMHSPYMQNIVKALIRKGHPPGEAYAIAWGAMRKWSKGGGKVHPEVRAAAAGGLGLEKAAEARAHGHANEGTATMTAAQTWNEVGTLIELAALPVRVPAGSAGGGQFGSAGGAAPAQPPGGAKAKQKAALLATAKNDRAKAAGLIAQRKSLMAALASASGKVKKGQAGAKTKAAASKTATTAPPVTSPAAIAKAAATAKAAAGPKKMSKKAQLTAQVAALGAQISQLLTAAANATAQAAKL